MNFFTYTNLQMVIHFLCTLQTRHFHLYAYVDVSFVSLSLKILSSFFYRYEAFYMKVSKGYISENSSCCIPYKHEVIINMCLVIVFHEIIHFWVCVYVYCIIKRFSASAPTSLNSISWKINTISIKIYFIIQSKFN